MSVGYVVCYLKSMYLLYVVCVGYRWLITIYVEVEREWHCLTIYCIAKRSWFLLLYKHLVKIAAKFEGMYLMIANTYDFKYYNIWDIWGFLDICTCTVLSCCRKFKEGKMYNVCKWINQLIVCLRSYNWYKLDLYCKICYHNIICTHALWHTLFTEPIY